MLPSPGESLGKVMGVLKKVSVGNVKLALRFM